MNTSFALDKSNAKAFGVCAGLARTLDWDVTAVRIGAVLATVFLLGPVALVAYLVAGLVAESR